MKTALKNCLERLKSVSQDEEFVKRCKLLKSSTDYDEFNKISKRLVSVNIDKFSGDFEDMLLTSKDLTNPENFKNYTKKIVKLSRDTFKDLDKNAPMEDFKAASTFNKNLKRTKMFLGERTSFCTFNKVYTFLDGTICDVPTLVHEETHAMQPSFDSDFFGLNYSVNEFITLLMEKYSLIYLYNNYENLRPQIIEGLKDMHASLYFTCGSVLQDQKVIDGVLKNDIEEVLKGNKFPYYNAILDISTSKYDKRGIDFAPPMQEAIYVVPILASFEAFRQNDYDLKALAKPIKELILNIDDITEKDCLDVLSLPGRQKLAEDYVSHYDEYAEKLKEKERSLDFNKR